MRTCSNKELQILFRIIFSGCQNKKSGSSDDVRVWKMHKRIYRFSPATNQILLGLLKFLFSEKIVDYCSLAFDSCVYLYSTFFYPGIKILINGINCYSSNAFLVLLAFDPLNEHTSAVSTTFRHDRIVGSAKRRTPFSPRLPSIQRATRRFGSPQ